MDIFKDKWEYFGLFVDLKTKWNLLRYLDSLQYKQYVNSIKNESKAFYIDHCTLLHRSHLKTDEGKAFAKYIESVFNSENRHFKLKITHIGISDKASAFKVELYGIKSFNKNPHITISVFPGGKPVNSNDIQNWFQIDEPIIIDTELKFV